MEAEAYYLQARSRGQRKASVPRSPTGSCLVSHPSCQLPSDTHTPTHTPTHTHRVLFGFTSILPTALWHTHTHTHTHAQGSVWFHIHPANCLPTHTRTHTHISFLKTWYTASIQYLLTSKPTVTLTCILISSPKSDPSCPQPHCSLNTWLLTLCHSNL